MELYTWGDSNINPGSGTYYLGGLGRLLLPHEEGGTNYPNNSKRWVRLMIIHVRCLKECLTQSKYSITTTYIFSHDTWSKGVHFNS